MRANGVIDNANRMVYDRLRQWIIRAFNGEYVGLEDLQPIKNLVVAADS